MEVQNCKEATDQKVHHYCIVHYEENVARHILISVELKDEELCFLESLKYWIVDQENKNLSEGEEAEWRQECQVEAGLQTRGSWLKPTPLRNHERQLQGSSSTWGSLGEEGEESKNLAQTGALGSEPQPSASVQS